MRGIHVVTTSDTGARQMLEHPLKPDSWLPHAVWARQRGVHPRTADRWEQAGIIQPAKRINKRKYRRADEEPRDDGIAPAA